MKKVEFLEDSSGNSISDEYDGFVIANNTDGPYHHLLALNLADNFYDYTTSITIQTSTMEEPVEVIDIPDKKVVIAITDEDTSIEIKHVVMGNELSQVLDLSGLTLEE